MQPQIVLAVNTDRSIPVFTETICDLGGTRTHGSYIKSVILYQLSYEVILRKANNNPCLSFLLVSLIGSKTCKGDFLTF